MKSTLGQIIRYGVVGALSNAVGYCIYLVITAAGMEHKLAMTLLYIVGVAQSFIFNKRWTFQSSDPVSSALVRYVVVYVFGYVINLSALFLLVDHGGFSHQLVMAGLFILMAVYFFLTQKFWVFRQSVRAGRRSL